MTEINIKKYNYLIIGGTTKAATTSLYCYLADHPSVSVSTLKETRFFLDENYPVQPQAEKWQDGIENFGNFFKSDALNLRVEATPDYLYSTGTPKRIKDQLPRAKVVFILRNPITRLVSWYKYAKQRNNIPKSITFDEYVDQQLEGKYFETHAITGLDGDITLGYFLSALEHGRYSKFLQNYIDELGRERIKIYFYEHLCIDPGNLLKDLCSFVSLESDFYHDYDFKIFNKSVKIENQKINFIYGKLRQLIRRRTHNLPIHNSLRQLRLWFDPIYYQLNSQAAEKVEISSNTRRKLEEYYAEDIQILETLLECSVPWNFSSDLEMTVL